MALGIDIHAYYQRTIRWPQVSGVGYVWVKTTDGGRIYTKTVGGITYYPSTLVNGAKSRGIPVGGYCYAQPGDGGAHGDILINENERLGATDLTPAMDIESDPAIHTWGKQEAIDYGRAFCSRAIRRGYRPAIYMNNAMAKLARPDTWPEDPVLWLARYGGLKPDIRFDVHQYTQSGSMAGATVDMNESYNNKHLNALLKPKPIVKPRTPSEGQMILLPPSPDTTGKPGMIPTPVIPTPGEGRVRIVIAPTTEPVYIEGPTQTLYTSDDSVQTPLDIKDRVFPGQTIYATLNADALAVTLPYSSKAEFRVAIYQMD